MKNVELDNKELRNIVGGKRTSNASEFSSKSDLGQCILSFFKKCN
ncbi:EntF family bacteriocin induction factor [Companilactobacillus huachuanensis]|uniref:EntF family bacteriocin induction factor n=1 Tax=Companilactobacillus huachuanensis TaxID=2559914 RepID=A0ABW1RK22_9LACO|nr:EntF family bacteriocin induction factor [Companilactobacillus huachuanensis]